MAGIDARTRWALVAMGLAIFVVANDFTALSVALAPIERDLHADLSAVQWVINAYSLVFGVLTVSGGRFADLFGRRRVFVAGALVFATFSLVAALAPSAPVLIGARAAMAIGGAVMWPATLAMTYAVLPEERRGLAGGLILGVIGLGDAAGPLLGGGLTDLESWRWVLLVNLPVSALAVTVVLRTIPATPGEGGDRRFDWGGMALISGSLVSLLVALDEVGAWGWSDPRVIGLLVAFAVLMAAFVVDQRRGGVRALIPADVLANTGFRAAGLALLLMSMSFFTALVYLPQFMERRLGFSPLGAGTGLLPVMLLFGATAFAAGPLYERFGGRRVVTVGAACIPVAMALLSLASSDSGYGILVPGMLVLGLGNGLFFSSAVTAAISSLDESRAGLASGILYMLQVCGGAVGLGISTTIVTSTSFVSGYQDALRVSAAIAAAGLCVVLTAVHPVRARTTTAAA
jgi:EmrB/QacA subfamily drug resistance transporter